MSERARLPGPDVVRAVALIGVVVVNYHGYLVIRGGSIGDGWTATVFDPFDGPFATRFAATFVLVAGVGVTLLTTSSLPDPAAVRAMRWRLARRGLLLYVVGLWLDVIWPGTILPFYGAMFVLAAGLFTLRSRWIVTIGVVAAVAGWALRAWRFWRAEDDHSTAWLTAPGPNSVRHFVFGVTVNGTHPLLPWLAFFCAGIVLGRVLRTEWWRPAALGGGFVLFSTAALVSSTATTPFQLTVLSTDPYSRGGVYVMSALGTALVAYAAIDWIAEQWAGPLDPLRRAGQTTLTLYLAHVFVFNLVVDWLGWIEPAGLGTSLMFALGFWVVGIAWATWWTTRYGRGPAERVYRSFGG